ncbi:hypothetical protein LQ948_13630 [Jiella sp. MQZ9-1]|uniref:Uncharacterized protein n=1 Tax=Jiella flava TaxID=2816857 RepID=A0A939JUZ9_9HYPH|nr:hypothetical protein [Jiella flava]MBO0663680.1 hypothetical protein [Jiella flava]MCD2472253.1 hypothetical protein [Jiella flava]
MIALTLLLCLNSNPTDCHRENVAFDGSIMQCALFGQAAAANYMRARPKWSLKRYRCSSRRLTDA